MVETYLNTFDMRSGAFTGFQHRSGTGLYWGNTFITDPGFVRGYELKAMRQQSPFDPWSGANGKNPLDSNDTEGKGLVDGTFTYVSAHTPYKYWPTGGVATVTKTADNNVEQHGAGWTTNQWVGYEVTNVNTGINSLIKSNTSDTLTLCPQVGGKSTYTIGDSFVIYHLARASLDQPGMGKIPLPTVPRAGPGRPYAAWPNQQSEPLYSWLNIKNGSNYLNFFTLSAASPFPTIRENRDYFNWNTNFDGTAGVGVGQRSARPSTCAKGVAYWATDEGTLYVASAANKWSPYYKPYVYPHPLVRSGPASKDSIGLTFPTRQQVGKK